MKVFKKLFVLLLLVFVGFSLSACDDESLVNLADYQAKIAELEEALATLQSSVDTANQSVEDLQKSLAAALVDMTYAGTIKPTVVKMELENQLDLFGTADTKGVYHVNTGAELELELKLSCEYELNGVKYEFEVENTYYDVDYFWANTADYNNGFEFDAESNTITNNIPGVYGLAIYSLDAPYGASSYPAQSIGDSDVPGTNFLYFDVEVADPLDLLSSSQTKKVELRPEGTDQLSIEDYDDEIEYEFVSLESSNTAVATVSATGLVTAVAQGDAAISAVVRIKGSTDGVTRTITIPVTVLAQLSGELAGGSGAYLDLSHSNFEQKTMILAHMERWLINQGASIPVINNSGMSVYHERVNFLADNYVALMGYGAMYAAPDTGTGAGTADDPAYRLYTTADPSTLNHLNYADSIESDFLTLLAGGLVELGWALDENGRGVGFEVQASMSAIPYPVSNVSGTWTEVANSNPLTESKSWKFDLRQDLAWENGDPITADDFIFTYQQALSPTLNMRRANYYYGGSTPIAGARDYFDGKSEWSSVGIEKVDDHSFVVTYTIDLVEWDVCYSWSSFLYSPVHQATWEECLNSDGTSTTYGTSMDKYMACGPYKLSYWEKGKEYRFTKNDQFFAWDKTDSTVELVVPAYDNVSYTIVKDSNAALALFREGLLDVTGVPAAAYDEFSTHPNTKTSPGATSFRFSVNLATQAELDAQYGAGSWEAKPILQEEDFRWALYFGLDRLRIQDITKVNTGFDAYFTDIYGIVSPTADGIEIGTYRTSSWGQSVFTGIFADDTRLEPSLAEDKTLNYNAELATLLYVSALDKLVEKGLLTPGTSANPARVTIEIAAFDGTTWESVLEFVTQKYDELFNDTEKYGDTVVFEAVAAPQPGMDVYYVKQMTGQFDLALAGISGGTLDPMGFMECFCDDNRSGLFLNPGLDTHNASILIDLDLDGDGVTDGEKYWSFDALYSAYYQRTYVKDGCEAEDPNPTPAA